MASEPELPPAPPLAVSLLAAFGLLACSAEGGESGSAVASDASDPDAVPAAPAEDGADLSILYDRFRVPHLFGVDDEAVFFGLGYTQARDFPIATLANLWSATGRFAEVAGETVLPRDRRLRHSGIPDRARAQAAGETDLEEEVRGLLEAYVDGVNAGRRLWSGDAALVDGLLGENGETWFDPVPPWLDPRLVRDDRRARLERLFSAPVDLTHVLALGLAFAGGIEFAGGGYSSLTNVWTIRNGREAGNAFLVVDSHQPIRRGGARPYFVQMSGDGYRAVGYSVPGFPCISLGFNDDLAYAICSMPKVPQRLAGTDAPFRLLGTAPHASGEWTARLEPDLPLRFLMDDGTPVELEAHSTTLRYWDADRGELRDDPSGEFHWYRVPETVLADSHDVGHAVHEPAPGVPIDPARERDIRFGSWSYLSERNPWEFWIGAARSRSVGIGSQALDAVLERGVFCYGRGVNLMAVDSRGGLEYLWMSRVPVPGSAARERRPWRESVPTPLDGSDPASRWTGFHPLADLPRLVDESGFGERPEIWINNNGSPHYVRDAGFDADAFADRDHVIEAEPWKSSRHGRARELLDRAAADGEVDLAELQRIALDVQDPWIRARWPLVAAFGAADDAGGSGEVRALVDWIERFRFEGPDGRPGGEEFLAHPMSQVTVFTTLLRARLEAGLLALPGPRQHELALAFDPGVPLPSAEAFLADARWQRCRDVLGEALAFCAAVRARSLRGEAGGLVHRPLLERGARRLSRAWPAGSLGRPAVPPAGRGVGGGRPSCDRPLGRGARLSP